MRELHSGSAPRAIGEVVFLVSTLYILQSQRSGKLYVGSTSDFERRYSEHNRGQTRSTRNDRPWVCVFKADLDEAHTVENWLKRQKSRKILLDIVAHQSLEHLKSVWE